MQGKAHMNGAMRAGREAARGDGGGPPDVRVNFGMPTMLHALKIFVELMRQEGRLAEIGNPPERAETS